MTRLKRFDGTQVGPNTKLSDVAVLLDRWEARAEICRPWRGRGWTVRISATIGSMSIRSETRSACSDSLVDTLARALRNFEYRWRDTQAGVE